MAVACSDERWPASVPVLAVPVDPRALADPAAGHTSLASPLHRRADVSPRAHAGHGGGGSRAPRRWAARGPSLRDAAADPAVPVRVHDWRASVARSVAALSRLGRTGDR